MAENQREEQKLWLILFQIKAIRTRLNLLAVQFWLFGTVAVLLGAAALIFLSALALKPLVFLAVAILVLIFSAAATVRVARTALRRAANPKRAAGVADDRAELKGRLATVLALAETPPPSSLWPYLIEDTYALRHRFDPSAVEPRWVSRSIFAPAAVGLVAAALLMALRYHRSGPTFVASAPTTELTADLGNLDIRPADPSFPANARVFADAATLRQLAAKLAQAEKQDQNRDGLARWMNKARQLAGSLQAQVTGQKPLSIPPLTLKLRGDKSQPPADNSPSPQAGHQAGNHPRGGASILPPGSPGAGPGGDSRPPATISPEEANRMAQNGLPPLPGDNSPGSPQDQAEPKVGGGATTEAGAEHSAGADPEHLFGPPSPQQLGSDTFKLTIDARPIDEASSSGAPAYLPPKVRVPLSARQFPDEPLARTTVPFDDRLTIKRVFER